MAANKTDDRYAKRVYSGMVPPYYDQVDFAYPSTTEEDIAFSMFNPDTELYELMATLRITYTDATKCLISSVSKTFKREDN